MATYLGLEMDAIVLSVNGDGTFDLKFDDG